MPTVCRRVACSHSWVMYFFVHNYAGFYTCVTLCTILYAITYNFVRSYVQIGRNYVQNCTQLRTKSYITLRMHEILHSYVQKST